MEYTDEKIIASKMEQKSKIPMSLDAGYYIDGKKVNFKATALFDSKLLISLPEAFIDMPLQIQELKYPSSFRPQMIKTNLGGDVNFAFSILENEDAMTGNDIANSFCMTLTRTNPSIHIYDLNRESTKEGVEMTFFDFTSYGVDQQLYSLIGLAVAQGKIIQCTFNCLERSRYQWSDAARDVFLSLEVGDLNKPAQ